MITADGKPFDRLPPQHWMPSLMRVNRTTASEREAWFRELGRGWLVQCVPREHNDALAHIMRTATRAELDLTMTEQERLVFADLPDEVTVYRGCMELNMRGVTWTTSSFIAHAMAGAYSQPGDPPPKRLLLLVGRAQKARGFIKLWPPKGAVMEVASPDVEVTKTIELDHAPLFDSQMRPHFTKTCAGRN